MSESPTLKRINTSILSDLSDAWFVAVIEKFAMHLAYLKGIIREVSLKNSALLLQSSYEVAARAVCFTKIIVYDKRLEMARTSDCHAWQELEDP